MKSDPDKLRLIEKIGYGFGDMASCLYWGIFSIFLLNFYTDVFGITAAAAATMFLVTRSWDLLFDPIMGVIGDRTTTRFGKFRPYLLWIPIPMAIVAVATFTTPGFSGHGKLVYAYITYGLLMIMYSAVNVPYAALLGVISTRPNERTALSSYRMMGAFFGSLIVQYSNFGLTYYFSVKDSKIGHAMELAFAEVRKAFSTVHANTVATFQESQITPSGYQLAIIVYAVLAIILFFATFALTKERVKPVVHKNTSLKHDVADLFKNWPWMILLAATVLKLGFAGMRGTVTVYYFKYYVQNEPLAASFLVLGSVASILAIYLLQFITPYVGKKPIYLTSMVLAGLFAILSYWVGPGDYVAMFVYQGLMNFFMGPPTALLWSFYADAADYSELKTGRRATGLVFSASGMGQKLGWTIAGSVTGYLLTYYNFQANVQQSIETQNGIRMLMAVFPAACCFVGAMLMAFYPLSDKKVLEIEEQLRANRQDDAEAPA